jgi:hypothetical protein
MALAWGQTIFADNLLDRAMEGRRWNATAGENNTAKPWRDWFVLFAFATAFRDRGERLVHAPPARPSATPRD